MPMVGTEGCDIVRWSELFKASLSPIGSATIHEGGVVIADQQRRGEYVLGPGTPPVTSRKVGNTRSHGLTAFAGGSGRRWIGDWDEVKYQSRTEGAAGSLLSRSPFCGDKRWPVGLPVCFLVPACVHCLVVVGCAFGLAQKVRRASTLSGSRSTPCERPPLVVVALHQPASDCCCWCGLCVVGCL